MNKIVTDEPAVTVVIPLYNRASLIRSTIQSVLDQTFQDFEIVVVDDGSTDEPDEVIRAIDDRRLRFVRQENAGANTARNHGIELARGKAIAFLDSDDTYLPHHLESAMEALGDATDRVVYGKIIVDRGVGKQFTKPPRSVRLGEDVGEYLLCDRGFVQTSTVVLPSSLASKVRYREGLPNGQDTDFAIRLAQAGSEFVMLEEPSARWRDAADPLRISSSARPEAREKWYQAMRPILSDRAYHGGRGWFLAKSYAQAGKLGTASMLYWSAVLRRCYSPKLAATIGLQLYLGRLYRSLTDLYLRARGARRNDVAQ